LLEDHRHCRPSQGGKVCIVETDDGLTINPDIARVRPIETSNNMKKRTLPTSRFTRQGNADPGFELQIYVLQNLKAPFARRVGFLQVPYI
jgi:hypothetical protein